MKKVLFIILLLPLLTTAQVQPLGTVIGNQTVIAIATKPTGYSIDAQALIYYPDDYFLPANVNKRYPLFLFLHGAGEGSNNNITQVTNASLPQQIKNGLKPYGIDSVTGDTIKFIVVSPHCAACGGSYSYPQLVYTIPYLIKNYRIDSNCMWAGGLSSGGRGTFSLPMGNVVGDTALGNKLAGIMPMANGGYDNRTDLFPNLDSVMRRGMGVLYTIGDQDPGWNDIGGKKYDSLMRQFGQAGKYYFKLIIGGTHSGNVWDPPFYLNSRLWNPTKNAWDQMANTRRSLQTVSLAANAGPDVTLTLPTNSTTFAGSGITPSPTTITGYSWAKISGPSTYTISSTIIANPNLTNLVQGTYVFRLTVTNSASATATDDITITVNAAAATPPTASAGSNQSLAFGTTSTTLPGTGSTAAAGHTISSYLWTKISGAAVTLTNTTSATATVSGLTTGPYIFSILVTDNSAQTDTAEVLVTVNPQGAAPNVVKEVACTEYKATWMYSDSIARTFAFNDVSGHVELLPLLIAGRKAIHVSTGFNRVTILDDQGYVWLNDAGKVTCKRFDTDTTGAAGNGFTAIFGYFYTYLAIRSDGTIWYAGADDYHWFGSYATTVHPITKWLKINQPAGVRFVKLACGNNILGLTNDGDVWQWSKTTTTYVKVSLPRPATDVACSHLPFSLALVPDDTTVTKMGYPYAWGSESKYWGGDGSTYATTAPQALKTPWGLTSPIKKIYANQNTIHFISNLDSLYGLGDNANGEVGNGQELVNRYDYPTPYAWSWNKYEFMTGTPVHVGPGLTFKDVFTGNSFNFYHYGLAKNDNLYFWGRNKSFVGGDGAVNNEEATYPNVLDVTAPALRTPLVITGLMTVSYHTTLGSMNPGINQVIAPGSTTLSAFATPLTLSASGKPNYGYPIVSYHCAQIAGPNSATLVTPNAQSTLVTGLIAGTYVFRWTSTDSQGGTLSSTMMVTVGSGQSPCINCRPKKRFIKGKTISQ